jgi:hypothetical protein
MAFPYVLLTKFKASQLQRHAMTPFLRGLIWLTRVELGAGFWAIYLLKNQKNERPFCRPYSWVVTYSMLKKY